ncbi:hypothetical protein [Pedobacter sp. NJ-S-72]
MLGIVVYINSLTVVRGERHYLPGAFIGTILITKIFIIRGVQLLSIARKTITKITVINDTVVFFCSKGLLRGHESSFQTTLDQILIAEELNPKKIFKDEKIFTFKFDGNKKLYFVPSFWDNQEEIIQLLKSKTKYVQ